MMYTHRIVLAAIFVFAGSAGITRALRKTEVRPVYPANTIAIDYSSAETAEETKPAPTPQPAPAPAPTTRRPSKRQAYAAGTGMTPVKAQDLHLRNLQFKEIPMPAPRIERDTHPDNSGKVAAIAAAF